MANPFLYIATTKNAWNSKVPTFMLAVWGFNVDEISYHPTWKEALTHEFNAGRVAGPVRWKEGGEEDTGTQCIFKMMWLPDVETFLDPLIQFIFGTSVAKIMGHDETIRFLENQNWNVGIEEL